MQGFSFPSAIHASTIMDKELHQVIPLEANLCSRPVLKPSTVLTRIRQRPQAIALLPTPAPFKVWLQVQAELQVTPIEGVNKKFLPQKIRQVEVTTLPPFLLSLPEAYLTLEGPIRRTGTHACSLELSESMLCNSYLTHFDFLLSLRRSGFAVYVSQWSVALVLAFFISSLASAQQRLPILPAPLREVTRLEQVAEPLGGLIPYRVGTLWGYADTTGHLFIQPSFNWSSVDGAVFFHNGFAVVSAPSQLEQVQWLPGHPTPTLDEAVRLMWILNVRGELLRVSSYEAAVRQPDGALRCLPRRQTYGQWELAQVAWRSYKDYTFRTYEVKRVGSPAYVLPILPEGVRELGELGANRVRWQTEVAVVGKQRVGRPINRSVLKLYALARREVKYQSTGDVLTPYAFYSIAPFHQNRAAFQWAKQQLIQTSYGPHYGYLDTLGRVVIAPQFRRATAFQRGRAAVTDSLGRDALIDRQGHYIIAPSAHDLSASDAEGYVRQALTSGQTHRYRYLSPPGRPIFATRFFDAAGPFRQGRAWVRIGSRQGLIDETGRWVTPLSYEQLFTPQRLRSQHNDAHDFDLPAEQAWDESYVGPALHEAPDITPGQSYPRPDTLYLLARRSSKYGLVARRSGQEVVPAIYDAVVANPVKHTVCLRRGGLDYVVSATSGRAVQGQYQGVDFLTPHGRRLYLTREEPARWALVDTTGRLRTAWLPGTGYPTPEGWLLCREASRWTLRDSTGRIAYASAKPIEQPASDTRWKLVQASLADALKGKTDWPYWQLPLPSPGLSKGTAFFVRDTANGVQPLDAKLRPLGQPLPALTSSSLELKFLATNWIYIQQPASNQYPLQWPWVRGLYTDEGQLIPAPATDSWPYLPAFDYAYSWHHYGVLPTAQGYLTRGGRELWQ
jgi:hypothetical protein